MPKCGECIMLFHVEKIKYCQSGRLGKDKGANAGGRRNFLIKMLEVTTSEHFSLYTRSFTLQHLRNSCYLMLIPSCINFAYMLDIWPCMHLKLAIFPKDCRAITHVNIQRVVHVYRQSDCCRVHFDNAIYTRNYFIAKHYVTQLCQVNIS